jgi:hypothetical protein
MKYNNLESPVILSIRKQSTERKLSANSHKNQYEYLL